MKRYNPKEIEPKWQKIWDEKGVYKANLNSSKQKYIAMSMFNYPSGNLHIGHAMNYTISDIMARYKRQQGYESYHPVGWDSFGLPAENRAIKEGISPQESMAQLIPGYHKAYKAMGWSNDWSKEISTHEPSYYKWTQWIFSQMYKNGLAYQEARMQWWCTKCQTVLANEQVIDGKCWRHDGADDPIVEKKEVKQWFFKITDYADELLEATDALDWSEVVKTAQKNWIGKSKGAEIEFIVEDSMNFVDLHGFTSSPNDDFHPWLSKKIRSLGYKIQTPSLPNTNNPTVEEQAQFVNQNCSFDQNTVLIAHSLGAPVALKVVERLKTPIKKIVLVAGFAQPGFLDHERPFEKTFDWKFDFKKIKKNVQEIVIMRAENDSAVPKERAEYLANILGVDVVDFVANEDHACGKEEPEVLRQAVRQVKVFTTRPDTLFGATFLVLAPEHDLVDKITTKEQKAEVEKYVKESTKKTEVERQASKEKTGVFTGAYAINPINNQKIPIWVADYVLVGYGTGAIMAVPAHDERDFEFAKKFNIDIIQVISPYFEYEGVLKARKEVETLNREAVDVIIKNKRGEYLLLIEGDEKHFVGGGVEPEDKDLLSAVEREVIEETGYTEIFNISQASCRIATLAYRIPKDKNQRTDGTFFEVLLETEKRISSEVEEGKHKIIWVKKDEVEKLITWEGHLFAWQQYLASNVCYSGEGVMINSGEYNGIQSSDAREKIVADLEKKGLAKEKTTFKIRDWSVSRQRYWGAPIPIINCQKCGSVLVPDEQLPVVLPELDDFAPSGDGRSALARAKDWLEVDCPKCGGRGERETDTLDTYICSSWYYLRYFDPQNNHRIFDSKIVNKWMPIDFYNGGDHATAHMIYARFITRFFHKLGLVDDPEPFKKFLFNGKVMASDGQMFSKSKGNGVDPLEIIEQGYGADALRTYLMFAAPLDLWIRWDPQGVPGSYRFLNRVWNLAQEFLVAPQSKDSNQQVLRIIHPAIKKVTEDLENQKYNTAIATMMKATNELYEIKAKQGINNNQSWRTTIESLTMLIAPFAPHTAEELWSQFGHKDSVNVGHWPKWDDKLIAQDTVKIVVQVNGKLRGQILASSGSSQDEVVALARTDESIDKYIGTEVKKVVYVPNRLINFVV